MEEVRVVEINGKEYRIPLETLRQYQKSLDITEFEAIEMWLSDRDIIVNEEVEELTKKAKQNKTDKLVIQSKVDKVKTERKPKENPLKQTIITEFYKFLSQNDKISNLKVENPTKIITFTLDNKDFKLDLVEKRAKK